MRKFVMLFLLCIFTTIVLVGCSNNATETNSTPATTTPQSTSTPAPTDSTNSSTQSTTTTSPKPTSSSNIFGHLVEDGGSYKRFKTTREEFITRYNQLARENGLKEILESNYMSNADGDRSNDEIVAENKDAGVADVYTYSLDNWRTTTSIQEVGFLVDEEDKILQVLYGSKKVPELAEFYEYAKITCLAMDENISTADIDNLIEKKVKDKGVVMYDDWVAGIKEIGQGEFGFSVQVVTK